MESNKFVPIPYDLVKDRDISHYKIIPISAELINNTTNESVLIWPWWEMNGVQIFFIPELKFLLFPADKDFIDLVDFLSKFRSFGQFELSLESWELRRLKNGKITSLNNKMSSCYPIIFSEYVQDIFTSKRIEIDSSLSFSKKEKFIEKKLKEIYNPGIYGIFYKGELYKTIDIYINLLYSSFYYVCVGYEEEKDPESTGTVLLGNTNFIKILIEQWIENIKR